MFRELLGGTKPKTADVPASSQQPKGAPAPVTIETILGTGTHFEGNLKTEGNVRVHGTFVGDITAYGRIAIGEQGKLDGDLTGESVDVAGHVRGNVVARKVAVLRTGRVIGDLRLEKLQTEEGAFVQGLVTMEEKVDLPARPEPQQPVAKEELAAKIEVEDALSAGPGHQTPVDKEEQAAKPEAKEKKEPAKTAE